MPETWQTAGFGLYVHWPFCQSKCPYCDFNSHVSQSVDQNEWAVAFEDELDRYAAELPGRVLRSVFFGGGTPSLMQASTVERVLVRANRHWKFANDIEITLEANPGSVERGRFAAFRAAGVNRVSLGVQALNDADLRKLGRLHSVADAMAALDVARETFERVSFDLIYARQDQKLSDWDSELRMALAMSPDHLSLYQLTIEEGTAFGDRFSRGRLKGLPDEDLAADMYEVTQDLTLSAGLPAYEISNHAVPGAESRHNMIYWNAGDWVGIGPGAHGRLTVEGQRIATETNLSPSEWLSMAGNGCGEFRRESISPTDAACEYLMMGLRTVEGVLMERVSLPHFPLFLNKINNLEEIGLVKITEGRLKLTDTGRPVLNAILRDLLPD